MHLWKSSTRSCQKNSHKTTKTPRSDTKKIKTIPLYSIRVVNAFKKELICYLQKHTLQTKQARDTVNNVSYVCFKICKQRFWKPELKWNSKHQKNYTVSIGNSCLVPFANQTDRCWRTDDILTLWQTLIIWIFNVYW